MTKKKTPIKQNKNILVVLLSAILFLGLSYLYISQKQSQKSRSATTTPNFQEVVKILPTPPSITKWQKYTDMENGDFSFEYPSFMHNFIDDTSRSRYSGTNIEGVKTMINGDIEYQTWYVWSTEKFSYGNYEHRIDIQVTGPIIDTTKISITDWIKSKNWPSDGEVEEIAGISKITKVNLAGKESVTSTFREYGSKYPRDWRIYFKTSKGIHYINISVQGDEKELEMYQPIYKKIISTFKFLN